MAYTKTTWETDTPRSTANLNKMQNQYDEAESYADPKLESSKDYAEDIRKDDSRRIRVQEQLSPPASSIAAAGRIIYSSNAKQWYGSDGAHWFPFVPKLTLFDGTDANLFFPKADWIAHESTGTDNFATDTGDYLHFGIDNEGAREAFFQFAKGFRSVYRGVWLDWELLHDLSVGGTGAWVILPGINFTRSAHARQQEFIPVSSEATFSDHGVGLYGEALNTVEIKIWKLIVFL